MNAMNSNVYIKLLQRLTHETHTWLITGVAGFIGSNLLEVLLRLNQKVIGLDNFATGYRNNLDDVRKLVGPAQWSSFRFIEGDIRNLDTCRTACEDVQFVLHHAALGSVPRSVEDPILANDVNIGGFVNMLVAARDARIERFVFAASSSTYGDSQGLPKVEEIIGRPLSPYAVTKLVNELYADVFSLNYGLASIGLRYFNIFGPRQDPNGAYAAVIPQWIAAMIAGKTIYINGDGETSRDFCYIANVVQANLLAATCEDPNAINQVYNVSVGDRTTLNELFEYLRGGLETRFPQLRDCRPVYRDFRTADVRHSLADVSKARRLLGYEPTHSVKSGLEDAMAWYVARLASD